MTALVTGGTGFLGRILVQNLVERGVQVRALQRSFDPDLADRGVELWEGSLLDSDLREAVRGVDVVYHLAGRVERDRRRAHEMYALHVDGTRRLLEALRGESVRKIVVASTSGTVGVSDDPDWIATDDDRHADEVVGRWPYYLSKIYAERVCMEAVERDSLPVVLLRPTLLLGPGDRRESSTGDVVAFMRGNIPAAMPGGLSFVDVRDVADAFIAAADRGRVGATYLLGAANMTLDDFFTELERLTGISAPSTRVPAGAARFGARLAESAARLAESAARWAGREPSIDAASVEMAQKYWYIDWSRAVAELGFSPRDPTLTLRDTVSWIRKNHPDFATKRREPPDWTRASDQSHTS